jgi:aldose 1-epimerase
VTLFAVTNAGVELDALSFGAILSSVRTRDRNGDLDEVVLGFAELAPYLTNHAYIGAMVGRYANRIANGRFVLDGIEYQLTRNEGPNHLHGGSCGFNRRHWAAEPFEDGATVGVRFSRTSAAGEEGYPAELRVTAAYCIDPDGRIALRYEAACDAPTIVNLTQHAYFNLAGARSTTVLDHDLTIHADAFTPVGEGLIPTGELTRVDGTPFDFRRPSSLGARLRSAHPQLTIAGGFDHNFVLRSAEASAGRSATAGIAGHAAELVHAPSGRRLTISTTEPGLQFYDGHLLDGVLVGAHGRRFVRHAALCLETQHFPDSPNQPSFPSTTLRPPERYESTTFWQFDLAR